MKKILFIVALLIVAIGAQAQRANRVQAITVDTIQGAETVYFTLGEIASPANSVVIQALCTQTGGTSDGVITVQGSIDGTSYVTLADVANNAWISMFAADSSKVANNGNEFTITNGGVFGAVIKADAPFTHYRLKGVGTSGDTTKITAKYIFKK